MHIKLLHDIVCSQKRMACDIHIILNTSLVPRRSGGGAKEKNPWYTLFAYAFTFYCVTQA